MGQNARAIVVFGIDLGEDLPKSLIGDSEDGGQDAFEDLIAKESGLEEPATSDYKSKEWSDYWAAKRKAVADCPAALKRTCSYDYSEWILAINGTVQEVEWGAKAMRPLEIDSVKLQDFRKFCATHDVTGDPQWLMAAFYG